MEFCGSALGFLWEHPGSTLGFLWEHSAAVPPLKNKEVTMSAPYRLKDCVLSLRAVEDVTGASPGTAFPSRESAPRVMSPTGLVYLKGGTPQGRKAGPGAQSRREGTCTFCSSQWMSEESVGHTEARQPHPTPLRTLRLQMLSWIGIPGRGASRHDVREVDGPS